MLQIDPALQQRVVDILKEVDLGYLAEKEGVWTREINWEEEISLGEKQVLASVQPWSGVAPSVEFALATLPL